MLSRGFLIAGLLCAAVASWAHESTARPHAGVRFLLMFSHVGPDTSAWLTLRRGVYDVSERNWPLGCAAHLALAGRNGYRVVDLHPNILPHVPQFNGGARWAGFTAHLVAGSYRIEGLTVSSMCLWSVRISAAS